MTHTVTFLVSSFSLLLLVLLSVSFFLSSFSCRIIHRPPSLLSQFLIQFVLLHSVPSVSLFLFIIFYLFIYFFYIFSSSQTSLPQWRTVPHPDRSSLIGRIAHGTTVLYACHWKTLETRGISSVSVFVCVFLNKRHAYGSHHHRIAWFSSDYTDSNPSLFPSLAAINSLFSPFVLFFTALVNSAGVGLVNSLGSGVPGGQSNTPNLNPPSQIDPSSIERAYAALGLTYQGNQMPQQPPQTNMPNQGLPGQPGMRTLNSMG